jgi:hypothetical protein
MVVVDDFLLQGLPSLVEAAEIHQRERLYRAVLYGRDAEPTGQCRRAIAACHAICRATEAPVRPHRVEEVFVERNQIAAPL